MKPSTKREAYLESTAVVDWKSPPILSLAEQLASGAKNETEIARRCFEFVRDQIRHSSDYGLNPVTCRASEVLEHRTGFCFAKSHLLAALCRANSIPSGFCYQRLVLDEQAGTYCLHGLNAVFLPVHDWYRIDARGNRPGITADFCPPVERLAYAADQAGELHLPEIYAAPRKEIVALSSRSQDVENVVANLPDLEG